MHRFLIPLEQATAPLRGRRHGLVAGPDTTDARIVAEATVFAVFGRDEPATARHREQVFDEPRRIRDIRTRIDHALVLATYTGEVILDQRDVAVVQRLCARLVERVLQPAS